MTSIKKAILGAALLALGWTLGYAQRSEPQFVIAIDAPGGETSVQCVSGCKLVGSRDVDNPNAGFMTMYRYACGAQGVGRCRASVAGWLAQ